MLIHILILNLLPLNFQLYGAMCIMSLHQDICTHLFSWYCILLTKFSWLSCAVAKVIQCLQEYGNSNFIPELTGQHLHSTLWSHSESKFPSSFASFLIAGALWNLSFVIICMFSYYLCKPRTLFYAVSNYVLYMPFLVL